VLCFAWAAPYGFFAGPAKLVVKAISGHIELSHWKGTAQLLVRSQLVTTDCCAISRKNSVIGELRIVE
jgi:hypothetical protein